VTARPPNPAVQPASWESGTHAFFGVNPPRAVGLLLARTRQLTRSAASPTAHRLRPFCTRSLTSPGASGTRVLDQLWPFQCSMIGRRSPPWDPACPAPTTQTSLADSARTAATRLVHRLLIEGVLQPLPGAAVPAQEQ
jgi:hypothetical protein